MKIFSLKSCKKNTYKFINVFLPFYKTMLLFVLLLTNVINSQTLNEKIDSLENVISTSSQFQNPELFNQLTDLYIKQNESQKVFNLFKGNSFDTSSVNNKQSFALYHLLIGKAYYSLKNYDEAEKNFLLSIDIFKELNNLIFLEETMKYRYYIYEKKDDFLTAIKLAKEAQLISEKDPQIIHDNNSNIGYYFQRLNQLDSAEFYILNAFNKRVKYQQHENVLHSFRNLEYLYQIQGNYQKLLSLIEDKVKYCSDHLDNSHLADALSQNGDVLRSIGDSSAIEVYYKSMDVAEKSGNQKAIVKVLFGIGCLYSTNKEYDKALDYLNKSLTLANKHDFTLEAAYNESQIGFIYSERNNFDTAIKHLDIALKLNKLAKYDQQRANFLIEKASLLIKKEKYSEALKCVNEGIEINRSHVNYLNLAESYVIKAKIFIHQGLFKKAETLIDSVKYFNQSLKNLNLTYKIANSLYSINKNRGNYFEAMNYHEDIVAVSDSISKINMAQYLNRINIIYNAKKKDDQNKMLLREKQANESTILKMEISGVVIITILIFIIILTRKLHKQGKMLQKVNDDLLEMDRFKQFMTGTIVHDLKNPLNSIIGMSDMMKGENEEYELIYKSGWRMLNLVNNILDIQKFNEAKVKLNITEEKLNNIVEAAVENIIFTANEKHLKIDSRIRSDYQVMIDKEMIIRVFINLIENAVKYTNQYGNITITCESIKGFIKVFITDDGNGIPKENQKSIFELYNQVNAKKYGITYSTGLGLSYCKLAIEAHGGQIGVFSEEGKGSTFWFTLITHQNIN